MNFKRDKIACSDIQKLYQDIAMGCDMSSSSDYKGYVNKYHYGGIRIALFSLYTSTTPPE